MSNIPKELRYTKTHEWAKNENGKIRVGITDHAQHEITDVVHVELPQVGKKSEKGSPIAVVESVKAAFDIYSPVSGTVIEINSKIADNPELVNSSPYSDGFFFIIEASNKSEFDTLLSADEYQKTLK
ncbi:MAG: glycine cleavage system protein GcvH [Elusimicrobia bacterium]|nr:glycine cleavage system protein GcvH [Candidatus Liberimonas magnetica]